MRAKAFLVFAPVFTAVCVAVGVYAQAPATNTQTNTAPGTQNAPPPPGGTQESRRPPPTRGFAGGGAQYEEVPPEVLERGQKLYQANCSFCHGANAKGGESGPNLVQSIVVLHDEHGAQIGQVVLNGRPDKGMPKFPFTQQQVSDIAAFLHDKVRAAALRGTYQILNVVTGDPKKGEAYFNGAGGCSQCHAVNGDLAHIGSKLDPVDLQQHIVMPRQGRGPNAMNNADPKLAVHVTVTMPSGETMSGVLDHIDDFNVAFTDANGEYHSLRRKGNEPAVKVQDSMNAHTGLLSKYTDSDIHNLTAYLVTLK